MSNHDNLLAMFIALTGVAHPEAQHMLEAAHWSIERALDLHFAKAQEANAERSKSTNPPPKQQRQAPSPAPKETVKSSGKAPPSPAPSRPSSFADSNEDNVRAPIAPKREVLVTDYSASPMMVHRFGNTPNEPPSVDGQNPGISSPLDTLFSPPQDLLHVGTFNTARKQAEMENKWLLVDVFNLGVFGCCVLNRDVWHNPAVRRLLSKRFIFWQVSPTSPEGRNYVAFYHVAHYPHVAIIDPRTGEKMVTWGHAPELSAKSFCDQVGQFLVKNPVFGTEKSDSGERSNSGSDSGKATKTKSAYEQSEDAQLKAAIEQSLKQKADLSKKSTRENSDKAAPPTNVKKDAWKEHCGPEGGPQLQLQLRLPNGVTDKVAVPAGTKLKALILYVSEKHPEYSAYELITIFPKKNYSRDFKEDTTVEKAGIKSRQTLFLAQPK